MTNHARTKRNVRILTEKEFRNRGKVLDKQRAKILKSYEPKGDTILGEAKAYAKKVAFDTFSPSGRYLNQRQKRKLRRQCPHLRAA